MTYGEQKIAAKNNSTINGHIKYKKRNKLKGNAILFLTALIWGVSFIAQSKGVELISPAAFNGIRSLMGSIVLLPVIFFIDKVKKKNKVSVQRFSDKRLLCIGAVCGVCLCIATTLQTWGMVYTSPGKAGFITALYMIIVPIIGLFFGRRPQPIVVAAVLVAVVGLYLMCVGENLQINRGDVIVFLCSFFFAIHILVIDRFSPQLDGVKLSCIQFFVCGVINVTYMLIFEEFELEPVLNCWAALGYSGIMSCGVAYTLQIIGQKYTDPTSASILMSLESVISTLTTVILVAIGWNLTGGALNAKEILGCVLMFVAIIFVQIPDMKNVSKKD